MSGIKDKNKGFTLVELIVVLVILAILAAILVPTLLGYIDEAKSMQDIINAKSFLNAAQSELSKLYATNKDKTPEGQEVENCVIQSVVSGKYKRDPNGDANITDPSICSFTKNVLDKVDVQPYVLVIGIGSNRNDANKGTDWNVTEHDKFTVYFLMYMETKDSLPYFYYNGSWTNKYPRYNKQNGKAHEENFNQKNIIQVGPYKGIRLQYYCLVNNTNNKFHTDAFWTWAKTLNY